MATPSNTAASRSGKWQSPTFTSAAAPKAPFGWAIGSLAELDRWARWAADSLRPLRLALYGDLGTGKTALVRAFGKALGFADQVSSPTFVLHHEYRLPHGEVVHHFDLYRLGGHAETDLFGEIWSAAPIWFIEWPEAADEFLGTIPHWKVWLTEAGPTERFLRLAPAYG